MSLAAFFAGEHPFANMMRENEHGLRSQYVRDASSQRLLRCAFCMTVLAQRRRTPVQGAACSVCALWLCSAHVANARGMCPECAERAAASAYDAVLSPLAHPAAHSAALVGAPQHVSAARFRASESALSSVSSASSATSSFSHTEQTDSSESAPSATSSGGGLGAVALPLPQVPSAPGALPSLDLNWP